MHSSSCDCRQPDAFPPGGDEVFETLRALLRDGGDYPGIRCSVFSAHEAWYVDATPRS